MKRILIFCLLVATVLAGERPSNCYRTCSGVANNWITVDYGSMVRVDVNLSTCRFTSPPHVTTMLDGKDHNIQTKGTSSGIRELSATGFQLNIHKEGHNSFDKNFVKNKKTDWKVYWTATAYGC